MTDCVLDDAVMPSVIRVLWRKIWPLQRLSSVVELSEGASTQFIPTTHVIADIPMARSWCFPTCAPLL